MLQAVDPIPGRARVTPAPIRVAVLDDHAAVRAGLQAILGSAPDMVPVGSASSEEELYRLLQHTDPAVLILDVHHPGLHGLALSLRLKRRSARRDHPNSGRGGQLLTVAAAVAGVETPSSPSPTPNARCSTRSAPPPAALNHHRRCRSAHRRTPPRGWSRRIAPSSRCGSPGTPGPRSARPCGCPPPRSSSAPPGSSWSSRPRAHPPSPLRPRDERPGLARPGSGQVAGKDAVELVARADVELGEDLAQVVLDRARADEQPGADLGVGEAVAGEPRDLAPPGRSARRGSRRCVCGRSRRWRAARAGRARRTPRCPSREHLVAVRSCSRASTRRRSRRSHSP